MLELQVRSDILTGGSHFYLVGAALALRRYRQNEDELQVDTYLYFEQEGKKHQFITKNHCNIKKNISLKKEIVIEETEEFDFPEETRENQIVYYKPSSHRAVTARELSASEIRNWYGNDFHTGENAKILGNEYFAFLREESDNDYMVLLSTAQLSVVHRPDFLRLFNINFYEKRNHELFESVFKEGDSIELIGMYLGIRRISDIYATENFSYFIKEGKKYEYHCLEKFDEVKGPQITNTRFYREISLREVTEFTVISDKEYQLVDYYIPVKDEPLVLKKQSKIDYDRYVPFAENKVSVVGTPYFSIILDNKEDADSRDYAVILVDHCRKTRFKKFESRLQ